MRLTREQRAAFFDRSGELPLPKLTYPGDRPCPVKVGHVEHLSANVWIEVTAIRRTRKGEHSLSYDLHRPGARFLAAQNGQLHPEQYTYGGSPIDHEAGEAVDQVTQKRITREARDRERLDLEALIAGMEQVRAALDELVAGNPGLRDEIRGELWAVRGRLDAAKAKLRRRMAA